MQSPGSTGGPKGPPPPVIRTSFPGALQPRGRCTAGSPPVRAHAALENVSQPFESRFSILPGKQHQFRAFPQRGLIPLLGTTAHSRCAGVRPEFVTTMKHRGETHISAVARPDAAEFLSRHTHRRVFPAEGVLCYVDTDTLARPARVLKEGARPDRASGACPPPEGLCPGSTNPDPTTGFLTGI